MVNVMKNFEMALHNQFNILSDLGNLETEQDIFAETNVDVQWNSFKN